MTQVVVCAKCGATFKNRKFWALPSSGDIPRERCPRCAARGPFRDATQADIAAFSNKMGKNFGIITIAELIGLIAWILVVISHYK